MSHRFVDFFEGRLLCLIAAVISGCGLFASAPTAASAAEVNRQFTLSPGGYVCFTYPQTGSNAPVHIMVSASSANGAYLSPAVVSAVVNRDTTAGRFTWIATNGDGTTSASDGAGGNFLIAYGAGRAFFLNTCGTTGKFNQIALQSAANSKYKYNYYVTMIY